MFPGILPFGGGGLGIQLPGQTRFLRFQTGPLALQNGIVQRHFRSEKPDRSRGLGIRPVGFQFRVVEEREEAVVVPHRDRIVFVIMTLGALQSGAEPDHAHGVDPVEHLVDPSFLRIAASFDVGGGTAVEAGGDFLRFGGSREEISRDLLDGELIKRQIRIQRCDDPIPVWPEIPQVIALEAMGVRIASIVQPWPCPANSELGGLEKAVDHPFISPGSVVGDKIGHFGGRRGQSGQVQGDPSDQGGAVRLGGGKHFLLAEPVLHKGVDRRESGIAPGHWWPHRVDIGPVRELSSIVGPGGS